MNATITDSYLPPKSISWSEETGNGQMTIKWTTWEPITGSRTSMLFVDGVQKDSTYTATFKVNDRDWDHDVTVDVIEKKEVSTSTLSGSNTIMSCGYNGPRWLPRPPGGPAASSLASWTVQIRSLGTPIR
eukprot:sb/3475215/